MSRSHTLAVLLFVLFITAPAQAFDEQEYNTVTTQAKALLNSGNVEEGLKVMRDQAKKEPGEGAWHASIGEYLIQLSQMRALDDPAKSKKWLVEAEKEFKKSAELFKRQNKPAFEAQSYYYLGTIEEQGRGDYEKGMKWYTKVLDLHPTHPQAREAINRYGQWRLAKARARKT